MTGNAQPGPAAWLGMPVWGCGGDLGIRRDGSHATHRVVLTASVRQTPPGVDVRDAGAVGVPLVTAFAGLRRAGLPGRGQSVQVLGANGAVGQATMQIATHLGVRTIGVVRSEQARQSSLRARTTWPVRSAGTPAAEASTWCSTPLAALASIWPTGAWR